MCFGQKLLIFVNIWWIFGEYLSIVSRGFLLCTKHHFQPLSSGIIHTWFWYEWRGTAWAVRASRTPPAAAVGLGSGGPFGPGLGPLPVPRGGLSERPGGEGHAVGKHFLSMHSLLYTSSQWYIIVTQHTPYVFKHCRVVFKSCFAERMSFPTRTNVLAQLREASLLSTALKPV